MTRTDMTSVPAARNAAALKARDVFERAACVPIEPAILQPAELFLDRSGEDIRRRLYLFNDPGGAELCLRPDLTIPACRHYLDNNGTGSSARYTYCGLAFRYREDGGPSEFLQTGAEFFGHEDRAGADAEAMGLCIEAVCAAGLERFEIELGDLALFDALIDALDIPSAWAARLKRHFWRPDYFRELLRGLNNKSGDKDGGAREGLFAALSAVEPERARVLIEDVLELAGIAPVGGRSVAEISERFLEQAAERASALPPAAVELIEAFLGVSALAPEVPAILRKLTGAAGISIEPQIAAFEKRLELIGARGIDVSKARFDTGFGRKLEYYTGFVFELRAPGLDAGEHVAGGGRYDGLLKSLGAEKAISAVGCAINIGQLERALDSRGAISTGTGVNV